MTLDSHCVRASFNGSLYNRGQFNKSIFYGSTVNTTRLHHIIPLMLVNGTCSHSSFTCSPCCVTLLDKITWLHCSGTPSHAETKENLLPYTYMTFRKLKSTLLCIDICIHLGKVLSLLASQFIKLICETSLTTTVCYWFVRLTITDCLSENWGGVT